MRPVVDDIDLARHHRLPAEPLQTGNPIRVLARIERADGQGVLRPFLHGGIGQICHRGCLKTVRKTVGGKAVVVERGHALDACGPQYAVQARQQPRRCHAPQKRQLHQLVAGITGNGGVRRNGVAVGRDAADDGAGDFQAACVQLFDAGTDIGKQSVQRHVAKQRGKGAGQISFHRRRIRYRKCLRW